MYPLGTEEVAEDDWVVVDFVVVSIVDKAVLESRVVASELVKIATELSCELEDGEGRVFRVEPIWVPSTFSDSATIPVAAVTPRAPAIISLRMNSRLSNFRGYSPFLIGVRIR
jgi:hypothetical protein